MERGKFEKYKYLIKNTLIFGFGLIGSKFVQFILLPYFTNILTVAEYGTIDLIVTFVGLMVPILTLELSDSVLRFGLSESIDKEVLLNNIMLILMASFVLTILLSPLLYFYSAVWEYRLYIVLLIVSQAVRTNLALFIKAIDKVTVYSADSILTALVIASLDIVFLSVCRFGITGYFMAEVIGNAFSCIFLFFSGRVYELINFKKHIDISLLKQMLHYSVPLMFNAISWWVTSFSDRFILSVFFSKNEVGIYSVAAKIPAIVTVLLSVFTQAWIMSAVRNFEKDKEVRFFENVYRFYTLFLLIMAGAVIIFVKPIMRIYVGADFFEAWYYVPVLLMGTVFLGISNYYGAIYAAAKANILEIKSTIICAASNFILNLFLIPSFGIMGAVAATLFSYIVIVIVRTLDTRKLIKIRTRQIMSLWVPSSMVFIEIVLCMNGSWIMACVCYVLLIVYELFTLRFAKKTYNFHG